MKFIPRIAKARRLLPLLLALTPFAFVNVFAQQTDNKPAEPKVSEGSQACLGCHDPEAKVGPAVHVASLQKSPHKEFDCTTCHTKFTADGEHTPEMKASKVACATCHDEPASMLAASVHGKPTARPGDAPTCVSCHTDGKDMHAVFHPKEGTREERVKICVNCHNDADRMARNHVDVEAVSTYEASFHGKALLRYGKQDTAICTDCHTAHNVRAPSDPQSTVNSANVTKTCGQAGCHVGATQNFANSGFSHLHLAVKKEPILAITEIFFKVLTFTVLGFLLLGIAFDMRVALFGQKKPAIAPLVAVFVGLGFASLIGAIVLAVLDNHAGFYATWASLGFGVLAAITHIATKSKRPKHEGTQVMYQRFNVSQRIQHFLTIISFSGLVITGIPIRYPKNDNLKAMYMAMGGMDIMRAAHRVCAVILIVVWIYHSIELIVRWKKANFSFDSWTMWPRKRDLTDVIATFKYHLGITKEAPSYDRFQFREKFDYFAVYWGMPIMVFSGLILWYPVFFGGMLPKLGIPLAYIAHADEAVLAFLTIATWHFYNTHFKPSSFPMNPVFITGMMTEEQMEEEHGDELKRIKASEAGGSKPSDATVENVVKEEDSSSKQDPKA